jgi:serine/threonine-protein kinase RsbW
LSAGDDIVVRLLAPEEALLLIGLIRRCYGETYIDPSFYREAVVGELLASRRLHSIGAFTEAGELAGHMGISVRAHGGVTADAGMTLVDPAFRGRGIARRVAVGLAQQSMALGLVGVHDYPVTVHAATQRIGAAFGVDTGLMLGNMPGDVVFQEMKSPASGSRTSSLIRWLPFGLAPERAVYLPGRYRERIEALYAEASLTRTVLQSNERLSDDASELEHTYDERRQILRVAATRAGSDLATRVEAEIREAVKGGALVSHVDLPLCDPAAPAATEALRTGGFYFAGLLPEYRDGDVLRLQWLADVVDESAFSVLSTDATQAIAALVLKDRRSLSG